ncbi:hypothetical protein EVAR_103330_1 [Eumeta japonica]|uniref:Uncharacterized protein n=1 Tax=Eumeta variegata TaxID=151549 RepID=A0A4C1Z955_EUMVA|nr:hypothetical protein EVAR_103330_1 [Eumeta japonica]
MIKAPDPHSHRRRLEGAVYSIKDKMVEDVPSGRLRGVMGGAHAGRRGRNESTRSFRSSLSRRAAPLSTHYLRFGRLIINWKVERLQPIYARVRVMRNGSVWEMRPRKSPANRRGRGPHEFACAIRRILSSFTSIELVVNFDACPGYAYEFTGDFDVGSDSGPNAAYKPPLQTFIKFCPAIRASSKDRFTNKRTFTCGRRGERTTGNRAGKGVDAGPAGGATAEPEDTRGRSSVRAAVAPHTAASYVRARAPAPAADRRRSAGTRAILAAGTAHGGLHDSKLRTVAGRLRRYVTPPVKCRRRHARLFLPPIFVAFRVESSRVA